DLPGLDGVVYGVQGSCEFFLTGGMVMGRPWRGLPAATSPEADKLVSAVLQYSEAFGPRHARVAIGVWAQWVPWLRARRRRRMPTSRSASVMQWGAPIPRQGCAPKCRVRSVSRSSREA